MILDELRRLPTGPAGSSWAPVHGALGVALVAAAWPVSWLQVGPLSEYTFFFLWLGYILAIDALVLHRKGTSLLASSTWVFWGMFLASVPVWWAFEGINQFTHNWYYVGAEGYSALHYTLEASWNFSIVIPAVFETAEMVGTLDLVKRLRRGWALPVSRKVLLWIIALGLLSLVTLAFWPRYTFFATWLSLFLLLDPINYFWGRPSLLKQASRGDWRLVAAFAFGALVCGVFWEMWNYWAFPKWHYSIPFVGFAHVFEMPLLGYTGYLPFGLEVYAAYHFLAGVAGWVRDLIISSNNSHKSFSPTWPHISGNAE